jgi:hypothetical protein
MIWTISLVLVVLWLLGIVSGYTLSGFIHVLLVIAIVMILNRIIQGKNPLK